MKKIFIFGLFVFNFTLTIHSQESFQIDSTSKWIQEETWGGTRSWQEWNYSLSFQGDTLINDTVFLKMFLNGELYWVENTYSGTETLSNVYFGAVNEYLGKVFYVSPNSNSSITLYDFNYTVNDTIRTVVGHGLTIINVDTMTDNRKKYITNNSDQLFIVEGIGSNHGFYFTYYTSHPEYFVDTTLGCYYQYDSLIFLNESDVCYFPLPVDILENNITNSPYLYPIPAKNILRINIVEPVISIRIIDLEGQVQNIQFISPDLVDISLLRNGLYLMIINNEHRLKFIKK